MRTSTQDLASQMELLDHIILYSGRRNSRVPVYVRSSGKVTLIVVASTMVPWAAGRSQSDISIVNGVLAFCLLHEITARRSLPSVQSPFSLAKLYSPAIVLSTRKSSCGKDDFCHVENRQTPIGGSPYRSSAAETPRARPCCRRHPAALAGSS